MRAARPFVLSIGGYDPSAGAGVLSDIKTYAHFDLNGLAVSTCLTGQSHDQVYDISWFEEEEINMQLSPILNKYEINVCKIAVVKNWNSLNDIIDLLLEVNSSMKIVLDPVLKSSSGFSFCPIPEMDLRDEVLTKIFLITPNQEEFDMLALNNTKDQCHILLKSVKDKPFGTDHLLLSTGERIPFVGSEGGTEKHGSGCILSSSIVSQLVLGEDLTVAVGIAKKNIEKYLRSSTNLIGTLNT